MNRLHLLSFAGLLAVVATGCPIWSDPGPSSNGSCADGFCGGSGDPTKCTGPHDCGPNQTCGTDEMCHTGDCTFWGCNSGYACVIGDDMTASCKPTGGSGGSGGTGGAGGGGGAGGSDQVYCGNPGDCDDGETCAPDGTCQAGACDAIGCIYGFVCLVPDDGGAPSCTHENPAACGKDADCAGAGSGYLCVSGLCTAPSDQCFDQTQCGAGDKCAGGKCISSCSGEPPCPEGYACKTEVGICSEPAQPCQKTNDCGGPSKVCVDGACVPRAEDGECPEGKVWVENGCVPNQSATFVCAVDGQQDACAAGSICLHHSCYISCAPPNESACSNLPSFNVCKSVTTSSGQHEVCGSNQNLGDECDPTAGLGCGAGKICIDGFCK